VTAAALAVIAKAPLPGRSKTRLCPRLTPAQAAALAEAALVDTLTAVRQTPAARRLLILEGQPGPWLGPGFELLTQRGDGLDERLANAFADVPGPMFIIGMDTPQISPALLGRSLEQLSNADAILGPAVDGGYWGIGLRRGDPRALLGVPMSSASTLAAQREKLHRLKLSVAELPTLQDVDTYRDAVAVAAAAPRTGFARALASLAPARAAA
jgi:hypothetical protein